MGKPVGTGRQNFTADCRGCHPLPTPSPSRGRTGWGAALWCFGEHQGCRLQKLVMAAITLILKRFTIHQRLRKIEAGHCNALTGRASEYHTLAAAIWPPTFSD